jgi:DNA protecting protein DprA
MDRLDHPAREYLVMLASEVVDPVLDTPELADQPAYLAFRQACRRLSSMVPEDILVRQLVNHMLWLLLNYPHSQQPFSPKSKYHETGQLTLFPDFQPSERCTEHPSTKLYQLFCDQVVRGLLNGDHPPSVEPDDEALALLALCEIRGVGYWTVRKLARNGLLRYLFNLGSREEFASCLRAVGARVTESALDGWRSGLLERGRDLQDSLGNRGVAVIHQSHPSFPPQLRSIDDPPLWLFVQGDPAILMRRSVATVGTRHPTGDGLELASIIGDYLPEFGSVIVSGLAEGIDQLMHLRSIKWGVPTIAVLGTGIFTNFPSGSEPIREQICQEGGAVVTEYLPRDSYSAKNFVRRNRIQAGLASVVIPVQWREKGGTAHTVRYAYEAKRKIVCPRLANWDEDDHTELRVAREMGAKVFSLPEDKEAFVKAVRTEGGQE